MSTVTRWWVDFPTPFAGLWAIPYQDFVVHVRVGPPAEGGCDRHSAVVASICEIATLPGQPLDFPFVGNAAMQVLNIAPRDDGIIDMRVWVAWHEPLNVRINFLVSND